jgi:putative Ca2+/H+ antiporter (TMEM165/GDT1 family)
MDDLLISLALVGESPGVISHGTMSDESKQISAMGMTACFIVQAKLGSPLGIIAITPPAMKVTTVLCMRLKIGSVTRFPGGLFVFFNILADSMVRSA